MTPRPILAFALLVLLSGTSLAAKDLQPHSGTAPDFAAQDLQGKPVRFSTYRGKVVLLNFWATWCPPCRKEMPSMERLHQAYGNRGLVVLAVTAQDAATLEEVRHVVATLGATFSVWHDSNSAAGSQFQVPGVPASFLIAHDGEIAYRALGEFDWSGREAIGAVELLLTEAER